MIELEKKLNDVLAEAESKLASVVDMAELEECRVYFTGRKGVLPALMQEMRNVSSKDKPVVGRTVNMVKQGVQKLLDAAKVKLESENVASGPALDVTMSGRRANAGMKHPVLRVMDDAVAVFRRLGFIAVDGPILESVYNNFDALNTPADHPSRDVQDTFYLPDGRVMRTQTSPVQIRVMESTKPPVRMVAPGRCFRRDTPDATHSMNFHQIEGLYVDEKVSLADLKGVMETFAKEMLDDNIKVRFRPHFFPFTEPSIECDFSCIMCKGKGCPICKHSGWLEIAGAGMVDPAVFQAVGYDPNEVTGYAFGLGIERIAMIRYAISDIRLLYENDMRFLKQFE